MWVFFLNNNMLPKQCFTMFSPQSQEKKPSTTCTAYGIFYSTSYRFAFLHWDQHLAQNTASRTHRAWDSVGCKVALVQGHVCNLLCIPLRT